jgi:prevent-host-death family protein
MRRIGIRELRQHASRYLRDVERGETIEVTDRGRPVARLSPVRPERGLEQLVAAGRVEPASADVLDLDAPVPPVEGEELPSETLARTREHER